jgi:hypothetical protein
VFVKGALCIERLGSSSAAELEKEPMTMCYAALPPKGPKVSSA